METQEVTPSLDLRLARRLRDLRAERGWSLDDLAARSNVSRATLSRLENGEVSPTTAVLSRLCSAHGMTLSRLVHMAEAGFDPLRIDYEASPRPGLEHHLVMLEGRLELTVEGVRHDLREGDCLRYLLTGPSSFHTQTGESARYLLFMV